MSEAGAIFFWIVVLVFVYVMTRKFAVWRAERTFHTILKDLEQRGAVDESSAVDLPYAKRNILQPGLRDFRIDGLKFLIARDMVGLTDDGRYHVKKAGIDDNRQDQS